MVVLLVPQISAATLSGSLYDLNLEKLDNVIVRIGEEQYISKNGDYEFDLTKGEYAIIAAQFDDNKVLIKSSKETINIVDEKNYYLDLILIESFDEEATLFSVLDDLEFSVESKNNSWLLWIILFIIVLGTFVFILMNKKIGKKIQQSKEDSERKLREIKKETMREVEKAKQEAKQEAKEEVKKETKEHIEKEVEKVKLELKATKNLDKSLKEIVEFISNEGGRTTQTEIRNKFPSSEAKISLMITELEHKGIVKRIKKGRGNVIVLEDK